MGYKSAENEWKKFGNKDPYFGVLADPQFHSAAITETARTELLASGERDIAELWQFILECHEQHFQPHRALDFGCGVGRLTVPLSRRCHNVIGVDVSSGMLAEARKNARGISNIEFVELDEGLQAIRKPVDFINSFIVFQHIPVTRGLHILERLVEILEPDGSGAIQLTYDLVGRSRFLNKLRPVLSLLRGRDRPRMDMHTYPLNTVFRLLQTANCKQIHVRFTNHGGWLGCWLVFRKHPAG